MCLYICLHLRAELQAGQLAVLRSQLLQSPMLSLPLPPPECLCLLVPLSWCLSSSIHPVYPVTFVAQAIGTCPVRHQAPPERVDGEGVFPWGTWVCLQVLPPAGWD